MIKKLLAILVLGLLLSGNAYAKIIDLHCKFIEGNITKNVPHPGHEDIEKNTTYLSISDNDVKGYNIKLDTSKKKILEAPGYSPDGSTYGFNDDLIEWWAVFASGSTLEVKYTLNRYTGRLREYHKNYVYGDTEHNYWMDLIYDCSKAKRLF